MRSCILFVHGQYRTADLAFYKKLCRGKFKVAVDGGLSFFRKTEIIPDLFIGDMDSAATPRGISLKTKVLTFPRRKDKVDSQLAVEHCIQQGAKKIDLVQPSVGQPDHFVGNILLPMSRRVTAWAKAGGELRLLGETYEARFLCDSRTVFSGHNGDVVSVMPFSRSIRLTCSGTDYDVSEVRISRGDTRALRNRISARRAVFSVKGQALVWRIFSR